MPVTKAAMLKEYSEAIRKDSAAMFVGAGISQAAGYVNWKQLLREIAEDLNLDVERESDLVALAQYHLNDRGGRDKLNQILIDEFLDHHNPTESHQLIASLPIHTIWTTNYDDLLERAFENAGKLSDIKRQASDINHTRRRSDVTIYKMHGDKTAVADAVLAKEDYETYTHKRQLFTLALQGDLTQKTFMFLGVSFTDPNLSYILTRVRQLVDLNGRKHFCLLRRPKPTDYPGADYDCVRFEHWLKDLNRYNIKPVLLDDYKEVSELLTELNRRSHLRDVFIAGSAADFAPLGESKLHDLCRSLGEALVVNGFNVISGFGLGIGSDVVYGAMQALPRNDDERLRIWPFPQVLPVGSDKAAHRTAYRSRMIADAGVCVVISGNRLEGGEIVSGKGTREEAELTRAAGKIILPVGATGYVARELWDEIGADLKGMYGAADVSASFRVLGDASESVEALVKAVIDILKLLNR